jgi:hypothetical protein
MLTRDNYDIIMRSLGSSKHAVENYEYETEEIRQHQLSQIESAMDAVKKISLGKFVEFPDVIDNCGVRFYVKK